MPEKMNARVLVVLVLPLLSACASAAGAAQVPGAPPSARETTFQGCSQLPDHTPGSEVRGEFSESDCAAPAQGRREPVDHYRVQVDGRTDLNAVVDAPGLEVQLVLLGEDGTPIAHDEWTGELTYLSAQVPAGIYRLRLQSRSDARVHGRYTLRTSTGDVGFEGCLALPDAPLGGSVQGEWSVEDCRRPLFPRGELGHVDYYLLRVPARRDVTFVLESPGIGATLQLFTRDDGAPVADAEAYTGAGMLTAQLAPGAYVLRLGVAQGSERKTGRYTLWIR